MIWIFFRQRGLRKIEKFKIPQHVRVVFGFMVCHLCVVWTMS